MLAFEHSLHEEEARSEAPSKLDPSEGKRGRNSHQNEGELSKTMRKAANLPGDPKGPALQRQVTL